MKRISSYLLAILGLLCLTNASHATCDGVCTQYCGVGGSHGYCVDYIQSRLGVSKGGDARTWAGNISVDQVQADDVAIFDFGTYGHVAVVDSVDGNNITISEWNYGSNSSNPIEVSCGVTTKYHITTTRTISKSSVTRFWRPSGGTGSANNIQITLQIVGNVGWYPYYESCVRACQWYKMIEEDGHKIAGPQYSSSAICQTIVPALYGVDYDVVFGSQATTCHQ